MVIPVGFIIIFFMLVAWCLTAENGWQRIKYGCGVILVLLLIVIFAALAFVFSSI